jgi:hypothetical protein
VVLALLLPLLLLLTATRSDSDVTSNTCDDARKQHPTLLPTEWNSAKRGQCNKLYTKGHLRRLVNPDITTRYSTIHRHSYTRTPYVTCNVYSMPCTCALTFFAEVRKFNAPLRFLRLVFSVETLCGPKCFGVITLDLKS